MIGWFGSPFGRLLQAIFGITLLWIGIVQVTAIGLLLMMTGLITTVVAAAPPAFLVPAPAVRPRRQPPSRG
jgi:hypothetical protein